MKKLFSRLLLSLLIGGAMLYLATRGESFSGAKDALAQADWSMLLPFCLCMAAQHFFRTWRWGQLLAPIQAVSFRRLLPISTVGFFAILALPLRMGEIVRPYLIAQPPKLRVSHGLGTLAVERVFDGLFLAFAAFAAVVMARAAGKTVPPWIFAAGLVALGLFLAALVVLILTLWQRERAVELCRRLVSLVSLRLAERAASIAEGVVDGFRALPSARRLFWFGMATLLYWLFNALSLQVLADGFDLPIGIEAAIGLTALIGIGIMIPAGPGFIGNFELFAEGALKLYVAADVFKLKGGAFIIAMHATNAAWYILTGVIAMFSAHVSFTRVIDVSSHAPEIQAEGG